MLLKLLVNINRNLMGLFAWIWLLAGFPLGLIIAVVTAISASSLPGSAAGYAGNSVLLAIMFGFLWMCVTAVVQLCILPPLRILFTIDERLDNVTKRYGEYEPDFSDEKNDDVESAEARPLKIKMPPKGFFIGGGAAVAVLVIIAVACSSFGGGNTYTDSRDGQKYKTVQIGNQIWLAQNMNYNVPGSVCVDCEKQGRYYTWEQAKTACPADFQLASVADYVQVLSFAQSETKTMGLSALNSTGFEAMPLGFYSFQNNLVKRNGEIAGFWTANRGEWHGSYLGSYRVKVSENEIEASELNEAYGFSVRCVKKLDLAKAENVTDTNSFVDDRDGKKYRTVTIGNQIWMAENLKYEAKLYLDENGKFNFAEKIDQDEPECSEKYGCFYSRREAMKSCPEGWHLPSVMEFRELIQYTKDEKGAALMSKDQWGGNDVNQDKYGFGAIAAGVYTWEEGNGNYFGEGKVASFWTSSLGEEDYRGPAEEALILSQDNAAQFDGLHYYSSRSVRCVQAFFVDERDGQKYKTTTIGNRVWMAQNLNYASKGSKLASQEDVKGEKYGRLYDIKSENLCPKGWRLPSKSEWTSLLSEIQSKRSCENFGYEGETGKECDYHSWSKVGALILKEYGGSDELGLSLTYAGNGFSEIDTTGNYNWNFCIDRHKKAYDYCSNGDIYWSVRCVRKTSASDKLFADAIDAVLKSVSAAAEVPFKNDPISAKGDFKWLSRTKLSEGDLKKYSKKELMLLRNAILAKHGCSFKDRELKSYFNQFSWYNPAYTYVDDMLTATERANVALIKQMEK